MTTPMRGALAPRAGLLLILAASATAGAAQSGAASSTRLIVTNAIARRRATLADIRQCRYAALVKVVARDLGQPQDSARSVLLLATVSSSAYWEHPDRYQETIEAHHRAADAGIGRELVSVRDIVDLGWDRIDLESGAAASPVGDAPSRTRLGRDRAGGSRYSIISPIASDALDHYAYAVRDTLLVDGRRIIRVAVRPRSDASPLFAGDLEIADSTFDVVAMNLGVTSAVRFPGVSRLRYEARLSDVGNGRWMPDEIRLTGELRRRISARWLPKTLAGIRLPEFPRQVSFEQVASLSGYNFDAGVPPPDLAEYRAVVRDEADQADSGTWSTPGAIPLTDAERAVWVSRDSADHHPGLVPRLARDLDAVQRAVLGPGSFHFNRVDGTYLGVAPRWPASPSLGLDQARACPGNRRLAVPRRRPDGGVDHTPDLAGRRLPRRNRCLAGARHRRVRPDGERSHRARRPERLLPGARRHAVARRQVDRLHSIGIAIRRRAAIESGHHRRGGIPYNAPAAAPQPAHRRWTPALSVAGSHVRLAAAHPQSRCGLPAAQRGLDARHGGSPDGRARAHPERLRVSPLHLSARAPAADPCAGYHDDHSCRRRRRARRPPATLFHGRVRATALGGRGSRVQHTRPDAIRRESGLDAVGASGRRSTALPGGRT